MTAVRTVAVFCGASPGNLPAYHQAAVALGAGLARRGIGLIYGGGRVGLMGAVADGALAEGGRVFGVIPEFLTRLEIAHEGVPDLLVTDSMHTRKHHMFEMSDAFVSLPGGLGTFDETIEILTWRQLGLHDKPLLVCDIAGSSTPLIALIEHAVATGFARPEVARLWECLDGVDATLARLEQLAIPEGGQPGRL